MSKLDKRYLDIIYPSKFIPTRFDQPFDNINIHDIKSGIGNNDDCKTLDITIQYEYDRIKAHPVLKPGFYLVKENEHYLFPNDSVVLKEPDRSDETFYYFKLIDWPKPGTPIVMNIYKRNEHGYIEPAIKFTYRSEFTKILDNGVEVISPDVHEFIINEDRELVVPKENFYLEFRNTDLTVSDIENNCELLGQTSFGSISYSFQTEYFPIKDIQIYSITQDGEITQWVAVRDLNKLDYNSLDHYNYVQVIPEYGIVVFGSDMYEYNMPSPLDKIYIAYSAYPHIEYIPEFSEFIVVPKYLDISPSASGTDSSIVQISTSDEQVVHSLSLKANYKLEDATRHVYGPLQLMFDAVQMVCTAYDKYGSRVPYTEIEWHFDIDKGTINGYSSSEEIKTLTNSSGDTYANYHTPNKLEDLEEIIFRNTDKYYVDDNLIYFSINDKQIYDIKYCNIFTMHLNFECTQYFLNVSRRNSYNVPIIKCVEWKDNGEAENVIPYEYDSSRNILIYDLTKIKPWYYYEPNWSEFFSSIDEFPYNVKAGTIINHNKSEEQYHVFLHGGIIESYTTEPTWNDDLCTLTEISHPENPSVLKCFDGKWKGWTIYTDLLVKVWCTAKDKITGKTIRSNNIYMHIVAPYDMLGLYGFRFDTIPESLMDQDPLTI